LKVSRGLASGDVDNDGDLDLLVTTNGQDAELLRNDGGNRAHSVVIDLRSAPPNTRAIGGRVRVVTGARSQMREVRAGSSYMSQSDVRLHVDEIPLHLRIPFLHRRVRAGSIGPFGMHLKPFETQLRAMGMEIRGVIGREETELNLRGTGDCKADVEITGKLPELLVKDTVTVKG